MSVKERLDSLRIGDLMTLLAVRRHASITAAARALRVTPSQVSKAVARLEEMFGTKLLVRTRRGVSFTDEGTRLLPRVEEVVDRLQSIEPSGDATPEITIAAPSYLATAFIPAIASALPDVRLRGLELPPALIRAYAPEGYFQLALTIGRQRFPDSWSATSVGEIRNALFASPAVAKSFGRGPISPDKLAQWPFIGPVNSFNGQVVRVDDGCPLGDARRRGHEAQTIATGLLLAVRTDQLVFGPVIAARQAIDRGIVVEIPVRGWDVRETVFVSCDADRVLARVQRAVIEGVRKEIDAMERP